MSGLPSPVGDRVFPMDISRADQHCISLEKQFEDAVNNGDERAVEKLLSEGVDPNDVYYGYSALQIATQKGFTNIVRLLLDYGANTDFLSILKLTALHMAANDGHADIVRLLLERGANPNPTSFGVETPLFCAQCKGHDDIVELLNSYIKRRNEEIEFLLRI